MGRVCAGTALPASPERRGFGGTGTTLRPLSGALLLAPPSFCDGHSPSHTRTCGSVTQPHGTPAAPGAAPALTSPLPGGVPSIPAPGDATPERPAGLAGGVPERPREPRAVEGIPRGPLIGQRGLTDALGARRLAGGVLGLGGVTAARRGSPGRGDTAGGRRARGLSPPVSGPAEPGCAGRAPCLNIDIHRCVK